MLIDISAYWIEHLALYANQFGWDLFDCEDHMEILRCDSADESTDLFHDIVVPQLNNDHEAFEFVIKGIYSPDPIIKKLCLLALLFEGQFASVQYVHPSLLLTEEEITQLKLWKQTHVKETPHESV